MPAAVPPTAPAAPQSRRAGMYSEYTLEACLSRSAAAAGIGGGTSYPDLGCRFILFKLTLDRDCGIEGGYCLSRSEGVRTGGTAPYGLGILVGGYPFPPL